MVNRFVAAILLPWSLWLLAFVGWAGQAGAQDLTEAQRARVAAKLPKLLSKLEQHAPVHVIVLGDSVANFYLPGGAEESQVFIKAVQNEFLRRLADRFYYTGGVRDIKPRKGSPDNLFPSVGPQITARNLSRNGSVVLQALQWLTTDGLDNSPDLAIINFGINEAAFNLGPVRYSQILNRCVQLCINAGAEMLVLGCSAVSGVDPRFEIGSTRPYALAAKRVAEANDSAYVDLGDGSMLASRQTAPTRATAFREAVRVFESTLFSHNPPHPEKVHPTARGHRLLGRFLADAIINGPPARAYDMNAIFLFPEIEAREATLSLRIVNRSSEERSGVLCPLTIGHSWRPAEDDVAYTLAAGATLDLKIPYRLAEDDPFAGRIRAFHGIISTSFLMVDQVEQRLYDIESVCYPVSVDWPVRGIIEVSDQFTFSTTVRNNTRGKITGRYRAEWHGQALEGELRMDPNGKQALALTFRVPQDGELRVKESLNLEITISGKRYHFHSLVEASRAFALNQRMPLLSRAAYQPDVAGGGAGTEAVVAEFQATERALVLNVDLTGIPLAEGPGAVLVSLTLDARPSTIRDEPGYAGTVTASYTAADGPAKIRKLAQAAFGEGYDRTLDMAYIKASTSTRGDGSKRLSMEIPRAYFYLHEWNTSSTESNLGVNIFLAVWTTDPDTGQPTLLPIHTYALVDSGVHRDDTDGLGTLELVDRASGRWTIRIH